MKKYQVGSEIFETQIEKTNDTFIVRIKTGNRIEDFVIDWASYDQLAKKLRFYLNNKLYEVFLKDSFGTCLSIRGKEVDIAPIVNSRASEKDSGHQFNPAIISRVDDNIVKSPLAGRVIKVLCASNKMVERGDCLVVIESMKMENQICAHRRGVIKTLFISESNLVQQNQPLVEFVEKGEKDDSSPKSFDAQTSV